MLGSIERGEQKAKYFEQEAVCGDGLNMLRKHAGDLAERGLDALKSGLKEKIAAR